MGISGGPYIIRDSSLVLELDAADKNSYPDSGNNWFSLAASQPISNSLQNTPTFSTVNGGIFSFNGTNQYADYGSLLSLLNTQTVTYDGWLKWNTTGVDATILGNEPYNTVNPAGLGLRQRSAGAYMLSPASNRPAILTYTPTITTTNWHMVSITTNGTTATLYLNGNSVTSSAFSSTNNSTASFNIGRILSPTPAEYWNGSISNFRIYNRALSATEILQNYNELKSRFGL